MKPKIVKEIINVNFEQVDFIDLGNDTKKEISSRLKKYDGAEKAKKRKEMAKNSLESFIFDMQDKIEQENYVKCTSPTEKEEIVSALSEQSLWMEDDGYDAETSQYEESLSKLQKVTSGVRDRVKELEERPKAVEAIRSMLNHSDHFLASIKNLTEDQQIFSEVEINMLENLIKETREWRDKKLAEQAKLELYEEPALTINDAADKLQALDREMKYLINKAKTAKPLKPKKAKNESEEAVADGDKPKEDSDETPAAEESPEAEGAAKPETENQTGENETKEEEAPTLDELPAPDATASPEDADATPNPEL